MTKLLTKVAFACLRAAVAGAITYLVAFLLDGDGRTAATAAVTLSILFDVRLAIDARATARSSASAVATSDASAATAVRVHQFGKQAEGTGTETDPEPPEMESAWPNALGGKMIWLEPKFTTNAKNYTTERVQKTWKEVFKFLGSKLLGREMSDLEVLEWLGRRALEWADKRPSESHRKPGHYHESLESACYDQIAATFQGEGLVDIVEKSCAS